MKNIISNQDVEVCPACKQPVPDHDAKRAIHEFMENNKPRTDEEKQADFLATPAGIAMAKQIEDARPRTDEEKQAEMENLPAYRRFKEDQKKLELDKAKHNKSVEIWHKRQKDKAIAGLTDIEAMENPDNEFKGEVLEDTMEDFLKKWFPNEKIVPIKKGKRGGDQLLFVGGQKTMGKIKFECKEVGPTT